MRNCHANNNSVGGYAFEYYDHTNATLNVFDCSTIDTLYIVTDDNSNLVLNMENYSGNDGDFGAYAESRGNSDLMLNMKNCSGRNNDTGFSINNTGNSLSGSLENISATGSTYSSFDINTPNAGTFSILGDATLSLEL